MKPGAFQYFRPTSLVEAIDLVDEYHDSGKILAGGQSLVPVLNFRLSSPEQLIDINQVPELRGYRVRDGVVRMGALTRHRELLSTAELRTDAPLLPVVAPFIGHPQIRSMGTLGGSLSHADPSAELPGAVLALEATLIAVSKQGERRIPAAEFFQGFFTTALEGDEILAAVEFPVAARRQGVAFDEVAARHGDFALAGAGAIVTLADDNTIADAKISAISLGDVPIRLPEAEKLVIGQRPAPDLLAEVKVAVQDTVSPIAGHKASQAYKKRAGAALAARAIQRAWENAQATAKGSAA